MLLFWLLGTHLAAATAQCAVSFLAREGCGAPILLRQLMANNSAYQCDPNLKLNVRNTAVDAALCPSYENAGCRLSIDALVCDDDAATSA